MEAMLGGGCPPGQGVRPSGAPCAGGLARRTRHSPFYRMAGSPLAGGRPAPRTGGSRLAAAPPHRGHANRVEPGGRPHDAGREPVVDSAGRRTSAPMTARRDTAPPPALGPGRGIRVEESVVVRRTAPELFRLWRDLATMGQVFHHVDRVDCASSHRSHWAVRGPLGTTLEWDAEIINEVENRLIGWQSLPGADVDCAGSVRFEPIGDGGATEVHVLFRYDPPGGTVGA